MHINDKPSLFNSRYLGRNGKAQDNIKAKDYFSKITRLGYYLADFDLKLDHRVTRARCLFVVGTTLRSLAPYTWNKSKKVTVFGCKSSLTNE